jgi:hypothetical protein
MKAAKTKKDVDEPNVPKNKLLLIPLLPVWVLTDVMLH